MTTDNVPPPSNSQDWELISPFLDEILCSLNEGDLSVVALHYFENLSITDISVRLGISMPAAKKSISRALAIMSYEYSCRNVVVQGDKLASLLSLHSVHAAPRALTAKLPAALAAVKKGVQLTRAVTVANAVLKKMNGAQ